MATVKDKRKIINVEPRKKTQGHLKSKAEKNTEIALKIISSIYN
jgi:hypothetical protein